MKFQHGLFKSLVLAGVIAGAAGADRATTAYNGKVWGVRLSAYHFGAAAAPT